MGSPHRKNGPFRRSLHDYLHKPQRQYLAREFAVAQQVGAARWFWRLAPYPFEVDTAAAIRGILDDQVLPWSVLQDYIEEWAYPTFFKSAIEIEIAFNRRTREEAASVIPDLETLRSFFEGTVPENLVGSWAEDFAEECELLLNVIKDGILVDEPSLAGRFIHLPFLPLGQSWLSRVPLRDGVWIDRKLLELCEASAVLAGRGYTRLPAIDPHSLAWHRFYPPNTRWASPSAAPQSVFCNALNEAAAAVRKMPTRVRQIQGRPFAHIEDYGAWIGRRMPGHLQVPGMQQDGISRTRWNTWVRENADEAVVEVADYRLTTVSHKWDVRDGETVCLHCSQEHAGAALEERQRALGQLYAAAQSAAARSSPFIILTELQRRILACLERRAMTTDKLSAELGCDRRTMHKPGGINELRNRGQVRNNRQVGGYYRPDSPPARQEK